MQSGHATLSMTHEGTLKELVVQKNPPALHIYNVVEHGRRFVRDVAGSRSEWGRSQCVLRCCQPLVADVGGLVLEGLLEDQLELLLATL